MSHVVSPPERMRALPQLSTSPSERGFSSPPRLSLVVAAAQFHPGAPPPASGLAMIWRSLLIAVSERPSMRSVSPGFITRWGRPFERGEISGVERGGCRRAGRGAGARLLAVGAVIDDGADRDRRQQFDRAADMIGVVMADQQIIDPAEPSRLGCGDDPLGAARRGRGGRCAGGGARAAHARRPARIDQQRMALRGDVEDRGAALDIDNGDAERIGRRRRRSRGR